MQSPIASHCERDMHENLTTFLFTDSDDLGKIVEYLHPLEVQTADVHNLGLALGISENRLKKMKKSETFLNDVISAWLQGVDNVVQKGKPSWATLVEALRSPPPLQEGIARKILKDHP